ncbi:hypothetical protein OUZ56_018430 [Daphnia magna]|uniref:Uncharacterized protein n=1 Tax=Daphnia magna TaxID=35525 RepID=A0ABQ9Z8T8_9CRUS|nr:hypothetical protein OUZ56_018430 [Daphnia magna]
MKLYRYESAGSGYMESLDGNEGIEFDEDIKRHIEVINSFKPQKRGHDSCGNSKYKAGRESSARFRTQDETGLGSACCRHLNILVTGNLKTGESYRFVHHFHKILWALGYLYFCYDVICNYSTFAKDVSKLSVGHPDHENFDRMSNEMTGFLSVLHGRTHVWDCQVLHNGRWKHGAAASLGEEQEQVFAKLSRYGSVTKHMSPASRRDHLTEAIFYHNEDKEQGMVNSLVKRLAKASKKVTEFSRKLQNSLALCGLQEKDLPITLKHLQESALDKKNSTTPLDTMVKSNAVNQTISSREFSDEGVNIKKNEKKLPGSFKSDLEGYRMTAAWARKQMSQYGDSTSVREKFRSKMEQVNSKAYALLDLINEKSDYQITREMYATGLFPWNETNKMNLTTRYNLIDTWMLSERWQEEIIQTKREMVAFVKYFQDLHVNLTDDLAIKQTIVQSYIEDCIEISEDETIIYPEAIQEARACVVLITEELEKVRMILASATTRFQAHFKADEDEDSSEEDENKEDEACDEIFPIDEDFEIDYHENDSIPMLPADTEETTTSPPVVDGSAELDASNALSALEEVPVPPPPRRNW